jgi:hypothetical protein
MHVIEYRRYNPVCPRCGKRSATKMSEKLLKVLKRRKEFLTIQLEVWFVCKKCGLSYSVIVQTRRKFIKCECGGEKVALQRGSSPKKYQCYSCGKRVELAYFDKLDIPGIKL